MAQTYVYKNGTGNVATTFPFTFPYLKEADVKVEVKESGAWATKTKDTHYEFSNATTLKFLEGTLDGESFTAPASGTNNIKISRSTDADKLTATFYPGSAIRSVDLNDNFTQNLYSTEEAKEKSDQAFQTDGSSVMTGDIVFEGATANDYETTLAITDPTADRTITLPNVTGTVVTTGDTGSVTSTMITDGTIVNADINASAAIAGSKLAAATTSAPGSMSAADKTKLDGIETAATADQTNAEIRAAVEAASDSNVFTDADHSKLNAIEASATADQTAAEIRTLVESASDSNVFTDADHTKLNGIETSATADQTVTEIKSLLASDNLTSSHLAANSVTTSEITDLNVTTAKLAADAVTAAKIGDDVVNSEHYAAASIDTEHIADANITTVKIADSNVTTGKIADNAVTIAKLGCEETSISTTSDLHVPTSKAVNDHVVSLIQDVGGFHPIDDDQKFPNTNPDPSDNAGTIVSIGDAGGLVVDGSGVSTTGRTLGGSTVTINGIDSSLHSTTIAAGKGMLVQTTSTLNTYTYHRLVVDEAGVANAQALVSDFNERYRVNAGEPSSHLTDGDLVFDTNANTMKVYDSTASAWKEVTSAGDFKYLYLCPAGGTGAPTINGSIATYDLREGSNSGSAASVTSAAQLMVSVNGVIQQANTGTSAPSLGFALVDSNTIIFGANLPTSAEVFIVQFGSALTITTPGDGTVTTAKIASAAVTTAKIADDAVDGAKLANNIDIAGTLDVTGAAVFDSTGTFAGNVNSGDGYAAIGNTGTWIQSGGGVYTRRAANSTDPVFQGGAVGAIDNVNILASGDGTFRDLTTRTVTSSDQVISNRSGTSNCFKAQSSGTDKAIIKANGDATFAGNATIGDAGAGNVTAYGKIAGTNLGGSDNTDVKFEVVDNGGEIKAKILANGKSSFAGTAFVIEDDGEISTNIHSHGHVKLSSSADFASPKVSLDATGGTSSFAGRVNFGSGTLANIAVSAYNDSTTASQPTIYAENDQTSGNLFLGYGAGAEKVKITGAGAATFAGNVGVGTAASATVTHHVKNTGTDWTQRLESTHASNPYGVYINYPNEDPNSGSGNEFISCYATPDAGSNTAKFKVWSNGDTDNATNTFGSLSDVKLKQDIVDAASQWDDIKAVKVRNFKFKTDTTKTLLGVVAQEIETVSPGLVKDTPDRDADGNLNGETTKTVKYSILYMKAIKALQEAMTKIETLETKVAALEAK